MSNLAPIPINNSGASDSPSTVPFQSFPRMNSKMSPMRNQRGQTRAADIASTVEDYRNRFSLGRMKGMINDLNIG